ncbi:MAG: hypothetical protein GY940_28945, partial [bacterium]|nr:hypothetical protein [bacterium]
MSLNTSDSVHIWYHGHHCEATPIMGKRYHCNSCPEGPENDLCETCYRAFQKGEIPHPVESSLAAGLGLEEHKFEESEGKPTHQFQPWLKVTHPVVKGPTVPDNFVLRLLYETQGDTVMGGYGFAASLEPGGPPLMDAWSLRPPGGRPFRCRSRFQNGPRRRFAALSRGTAGASPTTRRG